MKNRVCIVVQNYFPYDVRVKREAAALRSRGHVVSVIALCDHNEAKEEIVDGVNVYRVRLGQKRGGPLRYLFEYIAFFLYSFYKLNALDWKYRFDVVHINTLPDFLVFCAVVQKLKGLKIVLDMHEIWPEFFMSKYKVGMKNPAVRILLMIEKASLRFSDAIITVNESIKQLFQNRSVPGKYIEVVMNTLDESAAIRLEKLPHDTFNCVYHGTLTETYGLEDAIKAFSIVCKECNDIAFHIFGDGPLLSKLKQQVEELKIQQFVVFHGHISHKNMLEKLTEMDLGILASPKDVFLNLSFSNKLAEYVCLKIPVVSSDLDAVKYYFSEDQLLYFMNGNIDDLAKIINYAYNNKDVIQKYAVNAFEKYKELNWTVMAERYINVIELCNGPSC